MDTAEQNQKKKKIKLLIVFSLLFLILPAMVFFAPLLLTSEWVLKKHLLPVLAEKTGTYMSAEKISFDFYAKKKILRLKDFTLCKDLKGEKGDKLTFQAKNVTAVLSADFLTDWQTSGLKDVSIDILSVRLQKDGKSYRGLFSGVCITDLQPGKAVSYEFLTQLPLEGSVKDRELPVTGKGKILTDINFQIQEAALTLSGSDKNSPLHIFLAGKKDETGLWAIQGKVDAANIKSGTLFTFLQLKKFQKVQLALKKSSGVFSAHYKKGSELFSKTFSGTLSAELDHTVLPAEIFSRNKNRGEKIFSSTLPVVQMVP